MTSTCNDYCKMMPHDQIQITLLGLVVGDPAWLLRHARVKDCYERLQAKSGGKRVEQLADACMQLGGWARLDQ